MMDSPNDMPADGAWIMDKSVSRIRFRTSFDGFDCASGSSEPKAYHASPFLRSNSYFPLRSAWISAVLSWIRSIVAMPPVGISSG